MAQSALGAAGVRRVYGLELGCSVRRTGAWHIARLPAQLVMTVNIMSFHNMHNVVDCGVVQAMWEVVGQVVHRDQLS